MFGRYTTLLGNVVEAAPNPEAISRRIREGFQLSASDEFTRVLNENAGIVVEGVLAMRAALGDGRWQLSLDSGTLRFEAGGEYQLQEIGTRSLVDETWLWGWARDEKSFLYRVWSLLGLINPTNDATLSATRSLRARARELDIPELAEPLFSTAIAEGDDVAVVTCALIGARAYFPTPGSGCVAYDAVVGGPIELGDPSCEVATQVFNTLAAFFPTLDGDRAAHAYLSARGFEVRERGRTIIARLPGERRHVSVLLETSDEDVPGLADLAIADAPRRILKARVVKT